MDTIDSLFPNKQDCFSALFQDAAYEHDANNKYTFTDDEDFVERDRVLVIRQVMGIVEYLFEIIKKQQVDAFSRCKPFVNYSSLMTVLLRYSRDIYGFRRIKAKLQKWDDIITSEKQKQLSNIILKGSDFGFKIPSDNPYIHRQISVLLYWFSVMKPFHLNIKKGEGSIPNKNYLAYFNEYFSYHLIATCVRVKSVNLTLHTNRAYFLEFLNELHFRNLSRSSLEFFIPGFIS
ncbi:MAG: hypothetical protein FWG07_07260 [Treponema sp.]|nr:hypothetical protein [Treponema sp.]